MPNVSAVLGAESSPFGVADLERRTATALVYAVVVLAALFAPSPTFVVLVAVFAMLGYIELRALFRYRSYQPWSIGVFFTLAFVAAHFVQAFGSRNADIGVWLNGSGLAVMTLAIVVAFGIVAILVFIAQAGRGRRVPGLLGALFTLGGALYLGWGFGFMVDLWMAGAGATNGWLGTLPVWLLLALVPTWVGDSVAYLVGSRVGRRKIVPRISPGKTWEGTLAGFGGAAVVALLIAASAGTKTGPALLVAALVGPVGFAGDLFESAIKRAAGAKDSGTLFPGHGGVLDRIDSLIFVAPAVALVLALARP
jgi:phosphatidate cytidylyltransferase